MASFLGAHKINFGNFGVTNNTFIDKRHKRELFLSKVNNRGTRAAIEENNDTYCLQTTDRKVPTERH